MCIHRMLGKKKMNKLIFIILAVSQQMHVKRLITFSSLFVKESLRKVFFFFPLIRNIFAFVYCNDFFYSMHSHFFRYLFMK